ncbi:MAG TPA: DUF433 domain-containing protein [Tepidisphaeraceae bacterium]|jgi:uncharacterized protein (DUF433 family)
MPITAINHITVDENGIARIDGTRMTVLHIAEDLLANASTPEQMVAQWPHLSLGQIHAALSYYYDHKDQFDAEVEANFKDYQARREASLDSLIRQKIKKYGGSV